MAKQIPNRALPTADGGIPSMEGTSPARVLFVDDDDVVRLTVPRLLAIFGFDVTSVATVQNALAEIKAESFDVLLCALHKGTSAALEVISEMKKAQPKCKCFVLVGEAGDEYLPAAVTLGAVCIRKPITIELLVKAIREN